MRQPKDWGQPCPNPACTHARRMQQGNVRAIATYRTHSGTRRILCCHTGATSFAETRATVFCALRTSEEQVMMALTMRLGRGDLAGIDFGLGVTAETVVARLRRAAQQAEASNQHLLRTRPVTQVQRDERGNGIGRKHAQETDAAGASVPNGEDGRQGVWVRLAPECRWMIAAIGGPRTRDTAKEVVAATKARVAGLPACVSDGFTGSLVVQRHREPSMRKKYICLPFASATQYRAYVDDLAPYRQSLPQMRWQHPENPLVSAHLKSSGRR